MAVRMSMSVPFLWQEVIWDAGWGTYRGDDISGHAVVDGGAVSNFPIELFLSKSDKVKAIMGQPSEDVMGFLLDEKAEVPGAPPKPVVEDSRIDIGQWATIRRVSGLADTMMSAHDRMAMRDYKDKVVRLPAKDYSTIEFDMTPERLEALTAAGYEVTQAYLNRTIMEIGFIDQESIDAVAESILE
jgi:predicted acylesterase/phospholipase RssA